MTAVNLIDFPKDVPTLKEMRKNGTRVALWVHWPLVTHLLEKLKAAEPYLLSDDIADVYFGEREREGMGDFEQQTGKRYHVIPNAANSILHFPVTPVGRFAFDIVFLGAKLPLKAWLFDNVFPPLRKRYKVGIFGPYWTLKDNALRTAAKLSSCVGFEYGTKLFNDLRITIPDDQEGQLYSSAKICLNFHERELDGSQPHYIVNQRTFKIPACGGFEICDHVPAIRTYFTEDELVMARIDKDEWLDKIEYFLVHEEERRAIQREGTERALRDHTYHNRAGQLLRLCHLL
jgi:spore maturation protein CgeB